MVVVCTVPYCGQARRQSLDHLCLCDTFESRVSGSQEKVVKSGCQRFHIMSTFTPGGAIDRISSELLQPNCCSQSTKRITQIISCPRNEFIDPVCGVSKLRILSVAVRAHTCIYRTRYVAWMDHGAAGGTAVVREESLPDLYTTNLRSYRECSQLKRERSYQTIYRPDRWAACFLDKIHRNCSGRHHREVHIPPRADITYGGT
ncbi:hypothetical protein V8E55_011627 [Tylopilus felleus]